MRRRDLPRWRSDGVGDLRQQRRTSGKNAGHLSRRADVPAAGASIGAHVLYGTTYQNQAPERAYCADLPLKEQRVLFRRDCAIGTENDPFAVGCRSLLREVVDKEDRLIESDETDNISYVYFKVTGLRALEIIERGYGLDPWDPKKGVLP